METNTTPSCQLLMQKDTATRKKHLFLCSFVILSMIIHGFFVVDGFGEPDSVRLAIAAKMWHDHGQTFNSYVYQVSPLYLHLLSFITQIGIPLDWMSTVMNWSSLIIGSLSLIPMFLLYKRLINFEVALVGCFLYSFTPTFWMAHIYGMPLIHAFFCFLISMLLFVSALPKSGGVFYIYMVCSAFFASLALNFKADIVLCYGIFCGLCFYQKYYSLRDIVLSILLPIIALFSVLILSKSLFPSIDAPLSDTKHWSQTFPLTLQAITSIENLLVLPKSVGKWMFLAILIALPICLFKKKYRPNLLLVVFGSAPTFLFWGLRVGNSARHMMVAYLFLIFMFSFILFELTKKYKYWPLFPIFLVLINYFSCPASGDIYMPGSRLFSTTSLIEKKTSPINEFGVEFFNLRYPKKMYLGHWESPYIMWQVYLLSSKIDYVYTDKGVHLRVYREDGISQEVKFKYVVSDRDGDSFGPIPGWYLATINKSLQVNN